MTKIKLTQTPYLFSSDGACLEKYSPNGSLLTCLWDNWYCATAQDDNKNEYMVHWEILDEEAHTEQRIADICDWEYPFMVKDKNGKDVSNKVILNL